MFYQDSFRIIYVICLFVMIPLIWLWCLAQCTLCGWTECRCLTDARHLLCKSLGLRFWRWLFILGKYPIGKPASLISGPEGHFMITSHSHSFLPLFVSLSSTNPSCVPTSNMCLLYSLDPCALLAWNCLSSHISQDFSILCCQLSDIWNIALSYILFVLLAVYKGNLSLMPISI